MEILCETSLVREMIEGAQSAAPREACGLLGGRWEGEQLGLQGFRLLPNHAAEVCKFEIDPLDFLRAEDEWSEQGLAVCAFFHSHPRGSTRLSGIDLRGAWEEMIQVVCALPDMAEPSLAAWQVRNGHASPLAFKAEGR